MGNVFLKVLEKSLNFLFKNGYCSAPHFPTELVSTDSE